MSKSSYKTRLIFIFVFFFVAFSVLITRLAALQLFKSDSLSKLAYNQHSIVTQLEPKRGVIYDRNLYPLAVNLNAGSVYASPRHIKNKEKTARVLAPLLEVDEGKLLGKLKSGRSFVWIKRKIDFELADEILGHGLKGIGVLKEAKRFYPNGWLASHVIGFAGTDNTGLEGLENEFDSFLKGSAGSSWTVRDARSRTILPRQSRLILPCDGYNVVLTIDQVIQHIAEKELDRVYDEFKAKGASVIVMDPATGDILAMANRPTYDPNNLGVSDAAARRNRAVTDIFEPGSVFKIVTACAALENRCVSLEDELFCEQGSYRVRNHTLHDHKPLGSLTFREVIEKSSNIGTVKVAQILGEDRLFEYIKSFGFGTKTNLALPGEVNGIVKKPEDWSGISIAAIPIGQEIAVTPIQLVSAVGAIANDGLLMKPRIVLEVRNADGGVVEGFQPVSVKRVISVSTAGLMKEILEGVIERGTGKRARLAEYRACGKTGTAQKVTPEGRYSHSKFVGSFIGFAPVDNPKIAIAICVDEPRPVYYGGRVAAPAFKRIAEDVLRYLKVEPDRELDTQKKSI